jgi:hypothetical protein
MSGAAAECLVKDCGTDRCLAILVMFLERLPRLVDALLLWGTAVPAHATSLGMLTSSYSVEHEGEDRWRALRRPSSRWPFGSCPAP